MASLFNCCRLPRRRGSNAPQSNIVSSLIKSRKIGLCGPILLDNMDGFPTLKPAFEVIAYLEQPRLVGQLMTGVTEMFVSCSSSVVTSAPGYLDHEFKAEQIQGGGGDWTKLTPNGENLLLDTRSIVKTEDGAFLSIEFTGRIRYTEDVRAVLEGTPGGKTTEFGGTHIVFTIKSGDPRYKHLQEEVFVGGGHFILSEKGLAAEYKISQCA